MRTASDHLRKYKSPRPSTLTFLELRAAKTEQLQREIAGKGMTAHQKRKSLVERFLPWLRRQA